LNDQIQIINTRSSLKDQLLFNPIGDRNTTRSALDQCKEAPSYHNAADANWFMNENKR
jgi:hypothetical protein